MTVPNPTEAEPYLVAAVTANPGEQTPRDALQDELREHGRWVWPVVYGHIFHDPASDGLRLLAADYLETPPPEPCGRCGGTGVINTSEPSQFKWHDPVTRQRQCPACLGLKHDARWRANRATVIRASIELLGEKPIGQIITQDISQYGSGQGPVDQIHLGYKWGPRYWELQGIIRATRDENELQGAALTYGVTACFHDRGFIGGATATAGRWVEAANPTLTEPITAVYPISKVNLTTRPDVRTTRGGGRHHTGRERARIVGMPWVDEGGVAVKWEPSYGGGRAALDRSRAEALCAIYWPRITFTLPPPTEQETGGVIADHMDDAPDPGHAFDHLPPASTWDTPEFDG